MRLPAEWEQQKGIWLSWPAYNSHWSNVSASLIQNKWAEIASTIAETQNVFINTHPSKIKQVLEMIPSSLHENTFIYSHPNNDVWCRDHGAIFIKEKDKVIATNWGFNGWGENFSPWDLDNSIPPLMANAQKLPIQSYSEILEGGAID